jgi:hypothetical protein
MTFKPDVYISSEKNTVLSVYKIYKSSKLTDRRDGMNKKKNTQKSKEYFNEDF